MGLHDDFLEEVERFIAANPCVSPTALGANAIGDPSFVTELRGGRNCGAKTIDRVRDFMESAGDAIPFVG